MEHMPEDLAVITLEVWLANISMQESPCLFLPGVLDDGQIQVSERCKLTGLNHVKCAPPSLTYFQQ